MKELVNGLLIVVCFAGASYYVGTTFFDKELKEAGRFLSGESLREEINAQQYSLPSTPPGYFDATRNLQSYEEAMRAMQANQENLRRQIQNIRVTVPPVRIPQPPPMPQPPRIPSPMFPHR